MCDPFTGLLLGGAASLVSTLAAPKPAAPPPIPAGRPDAPKAPGATVRVGDGQDDETTDPQAVQYRNTAPTRSQGKAIGGLGMSGLSI